MTLARTRTGVPVLPDWREEFPPEGPTSQDPMSVRERYIALRLGEVSVQLDELRKEALVNGGSKDDNQRIHGGIKAAEAQLRTVMEMARLLKVNTEEAQGAAAARTRAGKSALSVLQYHQQLGRTTG